MIVFGQSLKENSGAEENCQLESVGEASDPSEPSSNAISN
jgi:hypothetical protein